MASLVTRALQHEAENQKNKQDSRRRAPVPGSSHRTSSSPPEGWCWWPPPPQRGRCWCARWLAPRRCRASGLRRLWWRRRQSTWRTQRETQLRWFLTQGCLQYSWAQEVEGVASLIPGSCYLSVKVSLSKTPHPYCSCKLAVSLCVWPIVSCFG